MVGQFRPGDVVTFEGVYVRPKWWKRALIWLRLRKPVKPPVLKTFVISWTETSGWD